MRAGSRKVLSSSSAKKRTLKAEQERQLEGNSSHGDQESFNLQVLLKAQTEKNLKKPWNRLDRGIRIQKVRKWVNSKTEWSIELKEKAIKALTKKIKLGGLSSSSSVEYDRDTCSIKSIPCVSLVYNEDSEEPVDILITKTKSAKRVKKTTA